MRRCDGSLDLRSAEGTLGEGAVSPPAECPAAAAVPPLTEGVWVRCPPLSRVVLAAKLGLSSPSWKGRTGERRRSGWFREGIAQGSHRREEEEDLRGSSTELVPGHVFLSGEEDGVRINGFLAKS